MKRRLRFLFFATSFLLLVVTATMWVRSYWRIDWLRYTERDRVNVVRSRRGEILFDVHVSSAIPRAPRLWGWRADSYAIQPDSRRFRFPEVGVWDFLGFAYTRDGASGWLAIPYWSITLPLLIPPAIALRRALRRRRNQRHGGCPTCGYDLRATPERCPECGAAFTPASPGVARIHTT